MWHKWIDRVVTIGYAIIGGLILLAVLSELVKGAGR